MTRGRPWDLDLRHCVVIRQFHVLKWNTKMIAFATGMPQRTVQHYIKRQRTTGTLITRAEMGFDNRGFARRLLSKYENKYQQ